MYPHLIFSLTTPENITKFSDKSMVFTRTLITTTMFDTPDGSVRGPPKSVSIRKTTGAKHRLVPEPLVPPAGSA